MATSQFLQKMIKLQPLSHYNSTLTL